MQAKKENREYKVGGAGSVFILIMLFLLYAMNYADRAILSVALEPIKKALSLTDTQAGLLQSVFLLGVALLTIPASMLVERWSRRKSIAIMGIIWSIATYATGLCTSFVQMAIARFTVGVGEAGYVTGGVGWLSLSFPKEIRSRIIGIFSSGIQVGTALGLIVGGIIITQTQDWRSPFLIFAIPGVILGIIAFFLPDYKTIKREGEAFFSKAYFSSWGSLFKIKSFYIDIIGQCFMFFVLLAFLSWMPAMLMRIYKMTPATAGLTYGLVGLIAIVAAPLGGFLADKWQKRNKNGRPFFIATSAILYGISSVAMVAALSYPVAWFIVMAIVQFIFANMLLPVSLTIRTDVTPANLRTTAYGIGTFITFIVGGTLGPASVGIISDMLGGGASGLQTALFWVIPASLFCAIAYFILAKYYHSDSAKINDSVLSEK
jgi:MFS family permease